jgi:hypothetical protein
LRLRSTGGYSGEGEHRFRREAERHSGAKVNSSRSEATLAWSLWRKCSESSSEIIRSEAEEVRRGFGVQGKGAAAPLPLLPSWNKLFVWPHLDLNGGLGSAGDSAYLIVDW